MFWWLFSCNFSQTTLCHKCKRHSFDCLFFLCCNLKKLWCLPNPTAMMKTKNKNHIFKSILGDTLETTINQKSANIWIGAYFLYNITGTHTYIGIYICRKENQPHITESSALWLETVYEMILCLCVRANSVWLAVCGFFDIFHCVVSARWNVSANCVFSHILFTHRRFRWFPKGKKVYKNIQTQTLTDLCTITS